jgi:hypothetical protein
MDDADILSLGLDSKREYVLTIPIHMYSYPNPSFWERPGGPEHKITNRRRGWLTSCKNHVSHEHTTNGYNRKCITVKIMHGSGYRRKGSLARCALDGLCELDDAG